MFVSRHWIAAGLLIGGLVAARGEDGGAGSTREGVLRDGFETPQPSWVREYTDTTVRLLAHDRSERAAHGGRLSEHLQFQAGLGGQFFVSYALPKVPLTDDLVVSLEIRSNQAGHQLLGRVVLPADVDPETKTPSFVLVPGRRYDRVDRWEKLELNPMMSAVERQARVLRASTRRPVSLEGAYLERVVVSMKGGGGETEVFLDDLQVGPVPPELAAAWAPDGERSPPGASDRAGPAAPAGDGSAQPRIRMSSYFLEKLSDDRRSYGGWFPTAIDAPGANLTELRRAGCDVLVTDGRPDSRRIPPALVRKSKFLLMPRLSGAEGPDGPQRVLDQMAAYPLRQEVALWQIGAHLGRRRELEARQHELDAIRTTLTAMRGLEDEGSHLATGTVDGEVRLYARAPSGLDVVGVQPRLWGTSRSFLESFKYLGLLRDLTVRSNPRALFWAWIPATTPPEVVRNIWGDDPPSAWGTPLVQPEQLRLMTYLALAAGYRGLTFLGDADLTRAAGKPLLIELSFLNAEIDLVEEILAQNANRIPDYDVFDPPPPDRPTTANVNQKRMPIQKELPPKPGLRAAAIPLRGHRGSLILIADLADEAQWQPPQMAYRNLTITPMLPQNVQALEISPGDAHFLERQPDDRLPGGTRFTLPDFGTTTMLLCTTDLALCQRIQAAVRRIRPVAAQMAIEQAQLQLQAVRAVHEQLKADGHPFLPEDLLKLRRQAGIQGKPPDAEALLKTAEDFLQKAREAREAEDYATAWSEARRAGRPLRMVMHGHWKNALAALQSSVGQGITPKPAEPARSRTKPPPPTPTLVTAISAPPCISFYTLPELYIWIDWIKGLPGYRFGRNRVPSGNFDDLDAVAEAGWMNVSYQYDRIVTEISTVPRRQPDPKKPPEPARDREEDQARSDRVLKMRVAPAKTEELDTILPPALEFPAAAVRSPPIRVETNNLIRISVLVKRAVASPNGPGVIVRDSIGGDAFEFRSNAPIPDYARVVLYRKAPADGTFTVTLGLAGYGEAFFDDLRVEVIEKAPRSAEANLVRQRPVRRRATNAPDLPDPRPPADSAARTTDPRRRQQ